MASLNDVLKEVLEKDFTEKDVNKVVNPDEEASEGNHARTESEAEQDDPGDSYAGPGDFAQNSIGRSAVESFIKNSIYEKYNIDATSMKSFARMTPTEMLSDFGKTVGDLGRIRGDYQAGKMTVAEYKSAMNHTRGEIVGKMLEMGSSRKSILEDVFLRSVGVGPEERSIHSFKDLVDAFRDEKADPVDTEVNPDTEVPDIEPNDMDINPDAEVTPDADTHDADEAEIIDSEPDTADVQESESDAAMDSEDVELEDTDISGEEGLPDDYDPETDIDIEMEAESLPEEVMEFDSIPDAQDFESMINSDVQDMADYAAQYEGSKEDIGDLEDYGDMDVDIDADFGDVDVVEEPVEPEANFEADIDASEIAEMVDGAEEAVELIAAIL